MKTILVIDDDHDCLRLLSDFLSPAGFSVLVAEDGESGVERAKLVKPDLILLDIMLPGLIGYEVADALRQSDDTRDIPIIFMSALSDAHHLANSLYFGGDAYLTKPLDLDVLVARIRSRLDITTQQKVLAIQAVLAEDIPASIKLSAISVIVGA